MAESIPNSFDVIEEHLASFFDEDADIVVLHEKVSELIHRDIYVIKATAQRPFHILLSSGMSALPMTVDKGDEDYAFAELMCLLPKDWNLEYNALADERNYWPIRIMKELMLLPHANKTYLGFGHSLGHEEDEEFAEGIGFNAVMLAYSMELSSDFTQIELDDNTLIDIYTLIPLYKEELIFKKENGANSLLEKFDQAGIEEVLNVGRKNVCLD